MSSQKLVAGEQCASNARPIASTILQCWVPKIVAARRSRATLRRLPKRLNPIWSMPASSDALVVIGGGLAGCEAAWQAAEAGAHVELFEMRPHRRSPAHQTDALAELVCSNSMRGAALENAVGLLKEELFRCGSLIVGAARYSAVPAG